MALKTLVSNFARRASTLLVVVSVIAASLVGLSLRASRADATLSEYFPAITVAGGNGASGNANQLAYPYGVAVDTNGNAYIADTDNNRIQKWAPDATAGTTVAGGNGVGPYANQLANPKGVAVDTSGNIYIADTNNLRIQKWAPDATEGTTVAGGNEYGSNANQLAYPNGVAVDASGNIYIADTNNQRIQKWEPGATEGTTVAGGNEYGSNANQLYFPNGVAVDATGNIYIADTNNQRIQKWEPGATEGTTVAGGNGQGQTANKLNYPNGVAVDAAGNIYIADTYNNRIQKWAPGATEGTTVAGGNGYGSAANRLAYPLGVAVDTSGNIYIADTENHRIQKWAFFSQSVTFGALNDRAINAPAFAVSATASTGLPVTFSSTTESVCTMTGTVVFLTGAAGECTIRATQAGTDLYAPALAEQSFAVVKDAQTITFGALKDRANTAGSLEVTGSSSSGLPVAFSSTTPEICFVEVSAVNMVFLNANGTCTIEATQDGDATYVAATPVERSFEITDPHAMVLGIGDTVMHEGSGPSAKTIAVDLGVSAPFADAVCVWWRTADVTATGVDKLINFDGTQDYMRMGVSKKKFAIIAANKTIAKLSVKVNYDTAIEADETFQIIIDKVTTQTGGKCVWDANAATDSRIKITRSTGTVTILDDDTPE